MSTTADATPPAPPPAPSPVPSATPATPTDPVEWPPAGHGEALAAECARLRAECPVARVRTPTGDEAWLVTGYALAKQVLEDERFSLRDAAKPGVPRPYALTIPPEIVNAMGTMNNAGLHEEVLRAFGPRSGPVSARWLRERAHGLVDAMVEEGAPVDLRARFAEPYSAALICEILGLPYEEGLRLMSGLDLGFLTSPVVPEGSAANWGKDFAFVLRHVRAPREEQRGLIRTLCELRDETERARAGAGLSDELLAATVTTLFMAGVMSTYVFLLHATLTLIRHPRAVEHLREQPEKVPLAVEELMRVTLPIGEGLPRIARTDVRVGDVLVREGELVLVCVEGANFDPAQFTDPERFDLDRAPNPHLSFGAGRHFCPASALSRVHASEALGVLIERLPGLRLALPAGQAELTKGGGKRVPERVPVLW
ncbi:cytochrome P450 [Streptomyces sp. NPDC048718]|uniref:cytochrome P450 n=1 Tax=Streptomyces sp. NPDC048718 TaxID=3365587 RepID=UPI003715C975